MLTSVSDPTQEGDTVRGIFTEGPRKYQSGLRIRSATDVENLCTCPLSRGRGLICAHSVAVALTFAQRPVVPTPSRYGSRSGGYAAPVKPAAPATPAPPAASPGTFTLFFPSQVLDGSFRGQAAVFLRFQAGEGKGTPADAQAKAIEEFRRACQTDEAKAVWANQGAEFPNLTGGQFDAFIKKELAKWSQVVKASGAKLD
jgi:hypothetical protein